MINSTTIHNIEIRRCKPAVLFTKAWEGNSITLEGCNFLGNEPDPVHKTLSFLVDSDKDFDHPKNGLPLRYTDEEIRKVWDSGAKGLSSFPQQLANEDLGIISRIKFNVVRCFFSKENLEKAPLPSEASISFDNGIDFYLNKIYKKVGVKTGDIPSKNTHMFALRRIDGYASDSSWDIAPPMRTNEINHNSPAWRRALSRAGIY